MPAEESVAVHNASYSHSYHVGRRALGLHRIVVLLLTSCIGTETSVVDCALGVLSFFFQSSAFLAAASHVGSFFRSASFFTRSPRSSSHLLAGHPVLLGVFDDLSSPGSTQPLFQVHSSWLCVAIRRACRHFSFFCFNPMCDAACQHFFHQLLSCF